MGKTNTKDKRSNAKHRSRDILKDKLKEENPVYVKFELEDALYSKKEVISSQIAILRLSKIVKTYNIYRQTELENKIKILKKIEEVKEDINKIISIFPKLKAQKKEENKILDNLIELVKEDSTDSLEKQLEEIQIRLKEFN